MSVGFEGVHGVRNHLLVQLQLQLTNKYEEGL